MKTDLSHLPNSKQDEIRRITEIIKDVTKPEMIILFGSYAKGNYVEHRYVSEGIKYEYISDYDFLAITKGDPEKVYLQENQILELTDGFVPPVNLEIHGLDYVNKGLEWGEYFWIDIVTEGIVLYDNGAIQFTKPRELTGTEKKEKAQRYFDTWFFQSGEFLEGARFYINRSNLKIAVFQLHQAAESLYNTVLLVFTGYKPKTHNLWKLRKKSKPHSETLFLLFRTETDKSEKQLFELLKQGYIDARYRQDFHIDEKNLLILIKRVSLMVSLVEKICRQHILELGKEP